jgi:hypothetical protein
MHRGAASVACRMHACANERSEQRFCLRERSEWRRVWDVEGVRFVGLG